MSNTEHTPKVPDTMSYTDEERELARDVQSTNTADRRGLGWKKPAAVVALLGAGAAAAFGIGKVTSGETTPAPERVPATSAPVTPGETANGNETSQGPLSVEQYQDGEELIRAYISEVNDWYVSGTSPEDKETIDYTDYEASLQALADKYDSQYVGMFVEGWESEPDLSDSVANYKNSHYGTLDANIKTTDSGEAEDIEPYTQQMVITSVTVQEATAQKMVVSFEYEWDSNADMNRGDLFVENLDGTTGGSTITFVNVDGQWKVSAKERFEG